MVLREFTINHENFSEEESLVEEIRIALDKIERKIPGKSYRKSILDKLESLGWSGKIPIKHDSRASIDGIRRNIGVVVQVGNHASGLLSLLNLEYLYSINKIYAGIFITQTHAQAVQRNSIRNPGVTTDGNYISCERFEPDLKLYEIFLKCPIRVIAIDKS